MNEKEVSKLVARLKRDMEQRHFAASQGKVIVHPWRISFCLACSRVFSAPVTRRLSCPGCGFTIPRRQYEEIIQVGRDAILFGHIYRPAYEEHCKHDETEIHLGIELDYNTLTLLSFVGIAAISGIIGNASYDLVKAIIRRILASGPAKRRVKSNGSATYLRDLYDDQMIKRLVANTRTHLTGYRGVLPRVKGALNSELRAQTLAPTFTRGRVPQMRLVIRRRPMEASEMRVLCRNAGDTRPQPPARGVGKPAPHP